MTLFEEQLKERKTTDQRLLENAFDEIADAVLGSRKVFKNEDERTVAKKAIDGILLYFQMQPLDIPENFVSVQELVEYYQQAYGLMNREVVLEERWYRDTFGAILAFTKENGVPVALLPRRNGGYAYIEPGTGKRVKINRKNAALFETKALSFLLPFPQKEMEPIDLIRYIRKVVPRKERFKHYWTKRFGLLFALPLPFLAKLLTGRVVSSNQIHPLIGVSVCLFCILLSSHLMNIRGDLLMKKQALKVSATVQTAVISRLLSMPTSFFLRFGAGELKTRADAVVKFSSEYLNVVTGSVLTLVFTMFYFAQIASFAPLLLLPAFIYLAVMFAVSSITVRVQAKFYERSMEISAEEADFSYSMINGVRKIRLVGAEKRMFARWMKLYSEKAALIYHPPLFVRINSAIVVGVGLLLTILTYWIAARYGIETSSYFAFLAAYGGIIGAVSSTYGITFTAHQVRPLLKIAEPILKTVPEETQDKEIVTKLFGGIDLDQVSFRYDKESPYIFRELSLRIKPKEYVAIVGKSGCGKSTLMRLLLGFEQPETGAIYYDGKNLSKLNLSSLHRRIGTVLQQSGLFPGDIYFNIAVTSPGLSLADAWDAAEKAGIADDIREMPMGMRTFVSEGSGTLSGGQKQRIMLARAIAAKPKLLLLDEATSALDNITQKKVTDALDALNCTRIVIAHRVSTIRNCSRIIVIDGGNIVEEGTYEELLNRNGFFAGMVGRQLT